MNVCLFNFFLCSISPKIFENIVQNYNISLASLARRVSYQLVSIGGMVFLGGRRFKLYKSVISEMDFCVISSGLVLPKYGNDLLDENDIHMYACTYVCVYSGTRCNHIYSGIFSI